MRAPRPRRAPATIEKVSQQGPAALPLTLVDLPRLGAARVLRVEGHDLAAERLVALGLSPGTEVRFERQAPFTGPLVVWVRGAMLCLRPREARRVVVEALP